MCHRFLLKMSTGHPINICFPSYSTYTVPMLKPYRWLFPKPMPNAIQTYLKAIWYIHLPAVLSLCHHWLSINRDNHSIHLIVDHYSTQGGVDIQLALCHSPRRFTRSKSELARVDHCGLPVDDIGLSIWPVHHNCSWIHTRLFQYKRTVLHLVTRPRPRKDW